MPRSLLVLLGMTIGSILGGFVPLLWGADLFSYSSLIANGIGGLVGIFIAYQLTRGF